MIKKPSSSSLTWINFASLVGMLQAVVFLVQSAYFYYEGMLGDDQPDYSYHTHHLCHAMTYVFGYILAWYSILMIMILLDKDSLKQEWALRVLGLPNIGLIFLLLVVIVRLYITYFDHDEHFFASTIAFACGMFMLGILNITNKIINNPFKQGFGFGRTMLYMYWFGVGALGVVCHYSDTHIHDYFSAGGFALLSVGVWVSKDVDVKMM